MARKKTYNPESQLNPFLDLNETEFEDLCRDLLAKSNEVKHARKLFGKGYEQFGGDILIHATGNDSSFVAQCKHYPITAFSRADIENAVGLFTDYWISHWEKHKVTRFYLLVARPITTDSQLLTIQEQRARLLKDFDVEFIYWDSTDLERELKPHRDLVREYLGDYWEKICLDPPKTSTTRFYANFDHYLHGNFTGRWNERRSLTDWYQNGKLPLRAIVALGGFGKSSLAWIWAKHDLLGKAVGVLDAEDITQSKEMQILAPPEAVLWWSFYAPVRDGKTSFFDFLQTAGAFFGEIDRNKISEMSTAEQIRFLKEVLERKRNLLILDGFERELRLYAGRNAAYQGDVTLEENPSNNSRSCLLESAKFFLRTLCDLDPTRVRVLMTTRLFPYPLEDNRANMEYKIVGLTLDDAADFFRARGIKTNHTSLQQIKDWCGNHPLALRLFASVAEKDLENPCSLEAVTNSRATEILRDGLIMDQGKSGSKHVFEYLFQRLSSAQQSVHSRIACFRSPIEHSVLLIVLGYQAKKERLSEILNELIDLGLLAFEVSSRTYDMHPLVRQYSYERLQQEERREYSKDLFGYYSERLSATTEQKNGESQLPELIEMFQYALEGDMVEAARHLFLYRLSDIVHHRLGYYSLEVRLLEGLIAKDEDNSPCLSDEAAAALRLKLSMAQSLSGDAIGALTNIRIAINKLEEVPDQMKFRPMRLSNLAFCLIPVGRLAEADETLQNCKLLYDAEGNHFYKAIAQINHGLIHLYCGREAMAEHEFSTALNYFDQKQVTHQQLIIWSHRAWGAMLYGNLKKAALMVVEVQRLVLNSTYRNDRVRAAWLEAALFVREAIAIKAGDEENIDAIILLEKAQELLEQAFSYHSVELAKELLLNLYHTQSLLYLARNDLKKAKEQAEQMQTEAFKSGYRLKESEALLLLAEIEAKKGVGVKRVEKLIAKAIKKAICDGADYSYLPVIKAAQNLLASSK